MSVLQRFIAPLWKLHSVALSPQQLALMIVQISDVTLSAHMGVWLDITWRAEINIWFASWTECGKEPFHTVNVSAYRFDPKLPALV